MGDIEVGVGGVLYGDGSRGVGDVAIEGEGGCDDRHGMVFGTFDGGAEVRKHDIVEMVVS